MIEQFNFPFTPWAPGERGDWGFSRDRGYDPFLDWTNDAVVHHPFASISVSPGWYLAINHAIDPRLFAFRKAFYTLRGARWDRDQIDNGVYGKVSDGRASDLSGAPLELDDAVILDAMIRRLLELTENAFRALPPRQQRWLEQCRAARREPENCRSWLRDTGP